MIEKICIVLIAGAVISFISGMSILYDKYRWFRAHPSDLRFDAEQPLPQQITKKEQMENVQKLTRDQAREIMLRHYAKSIGPEWNWYAEITTFRFYVCFFACIPLGAIFCLAIMSGAKSPDETKMEEYRKKIRRRDAFLGYTDEALYRFHFLEPAIRELFGEKAVYRENVKIEDISKSFFREEYLFAKEVIEGSIQNYNVKICNAILKNSNHFTWNGVAVRLDFKFHLNGIVFVLPTEIAMGQEHETLYKRPAEACRKIETDNIAFNEAYNVYAEDKLDAMRLLSPILIEKFVNAKRCDNEMALYATGNSVYILQRNIYFSEKAFQVPNTEKKVDELNPVNVKNDLKGIYNNAKNLLELINGGM